MLGISDPHDDRGDCPPHLDDSRLLRVDGRQKLEREAIAIQARERLQKLLDHYKIGVDIVTIKLQNSVPPPPVQPSFNEVNAAQQEARRIENEAERE